jgi:UDP-glucuronate decarboxylase
MNTDDDFTGPINLGNPHESTVGELAEQIIALSGARSVIEHKPLPADDPVRRCPDVALAERVLGWLPTVQLEEGLARTIRYFRELDLSKHL